MKRFEYPLYNKVVDMPVTASILNELVDILNECKLEKKRVGDLDRFAMQRYIHDKMPSEPMWALMLSGLLAHVEGRMEDAKRDLKKAVSIDPTSIVIRNNLAVLLADSGCSQLAIEEVKQVLSLASEQNDWTILDSMTELAVGLGDLSIISEIIKLANKLNICTPIITQAALLLYIDGADDGETLESLDSALIEEKLRPLCGKISDDRWAQLEKLADELEPQVN